MSHSDQDPAGQGDDPFLLPRSHIGLEASLLVIAWPNLPPIGLDVAMLDRIDATGPNLVLSIGALDIALYVADGADAAKDVANRLSPYTREAPISSPAVYEDAKRRLAAPERPERSLETDYKLLVADDSVSSNGEFIQIGTTMLKRSEVQEQAERGETLSLPGGGRLQAAMALLVVAAEQRAGGREDYELLSKRVDQYEKGAALSQPSSTGRVSIT